jgi:hypothetical protein
MTATGMHGETARALHASIVRKRAARAADA